jgi:hypothetical protein
MDLELSEIEQFHGTQAYHECWLGALATDGVKYVMDNGYSWLVTDAISIIKTDGNIARKPFLVIELRLLGDNEADMVITDGNGRELYRQHYNYTNARKGLKLYFQNNIVLLPGEY